MVIRDYTDLNGQRRTQSVCGVRFRTLLFCLTARRRMEVHAAMSASRIKAISSGRILSARLAFCVLLAAVCLLTFPRKSAQTFSLSGSTQSAGDVSTLKRDLAGERIANLS